MFRVEPRFSLFFPWYEMSSGFTAYFTYFYAIRPTKCLSSFSFFLSFFFYIWCDTTELYNHSIIFSMHVLLKQCSINVSIIPFVNWTICYIKFFSFFICISRFPAQVLLMCKNIHVNELLGNIFSQKINEKKELVNGRCWTNILFNILNILLHIFS